MSKSLIYMVLVDFYGLEKCWISAGQSAHDLLMSSLNDFWTNENDINLVW